MAGGELSKTRPAFTEEAFTEEAFTAAEVTEAAAFGYP
jgi:hypothetical protein